MKYDSPTDKIQLAAFSSLNYHRFQSHTAEYALATAIADTGDERFARLLKKNPDQIKKWLEDNKLRPVGLRRFTYSFLKNRDRHISKRNVENEAGNR